MRLDIEYCGVRGSSIAVYAKERPAIPAAKMRSEETVIPGRDGALTRSDESFEPTEITVSFNYIGPKDKWFDRWRAIKRWLSKRNGKLILSDDPEFFYKIIEVQLSENTRTTEKIGNFTATFRTLDGLQYLKSGEKEHDPKDVLWNPYEKCHPVYKLTGNGTCILSVNDKQILVDVKDELTIDTNGMITYISDGTLANTNITGDYKDAYLQEGTNTISVSEGFEIKVIPNWRCR